MLFIPLCAAGLLGSLRPRRLPDFESTRGQSNHSERTTTLIDGGFCVGNFRRIKPIVDGFEIQLSS